MGKMISSLLGKNTDYDLDYSPEILQTVKRSSSRKQNGIDSGLFSGYDVWNAYEFSYLSNSGLPINRILKLVCPSDSENIIESKSLKLYLGTFAMSNIESDDAVKDKLYKDIIPVLGCSDVLLELYDYRSAIKELTQIDQSVLIDKCDIDIKEYILSPDVLKLEDNDKFSIVQYSDLLRSLCPVTGQPDWATVCIEYESEKKITDKSLLRYIVSYRKHRDFHESCCEKIFCDIYDILKPVKLRVRTFYTRRGGIDINPCRFTGEYNSDYCFRYWRQ